MTKFETINGTLCRMVEQPCPHCGQPEIIATPVADGSAEWAWQMMLLGKSVINLPSSSPDAEWKLKNGHAVGKLAGMYANSKPAWLKNAAPTGWQLYEPEPEFKVGDWVEFIDAGGHRSQGKYLSEAYQDTILVLDIIFNTRCVVPVSKITRKLSPSEMIVNIGCLSGTVMRSSSSHFCLCNGDNWTMVSFAMLDAPTRELVESLLKAQEEK